VVEAELASPGLLVLSEAWYPGWKAVVKSGAETRETTIYRTNRVLRGVWLSAGKQTVEFRYEPESVYRGGTISGISWLALTALGLMVLLRRRAARQAPPQIERP